MERVRDQPQRPERVTLRMTALDLPPHARVVAELARAEAADGWAAWCHDAGRHLVPTAELVESLLVLLARLGEGPVVEICAGDGALAGWLRKRGAAVIATDASPSPRRRWDVGALPAHEALERYQPRVVIGSFVPVDAHIDRRVLTDPSVHHYIVLNARHGIADGTHIPGEQPGWTRNELPELKAWMVTRQDAWMGDHLPIRHFGEAWLLSRSSSNGESAVGRDHQRAPEPAA